MVAANSGLIVSISDATPMILLPMPVAEPDHRIFPTIVEGLDSTTSPLLFAASGGFFACFDVMTEEQLRLAI